MAELAQQRSLPRVRWAGLLRLAVMGIGLAPWLLAGIGYRGEPFAHLYASMCHQLPERTLSFAGAPMLVCSRCAGLYLGIFLGALALLPAQREKAARRMFLVALLLTAVDVVTQDLGLHPPWHALRLMTGALVGYLFAAYPLGLLDAELRGAAAKGRGVDRALAAAHGLEAACRQASGKRSDRGLDSRGASALHGRVAGACRR